MKEKTAKTVAELIKALQEYPPESTWNGWDDGGLYVYDQTGRKIVGVVRPHAL